MTSLQYSLYCSSSAISNEMDKQRDSKLQTKLVVSLRKVR